MTPEIPQPEEDDLAVMFYCGITAEANPGSFDIPDTQFAKRNKDRTFRLAAERFCDAHLVEHFLCLVESQFSQTSMGSFCPQPPGFEQSKMIQCSDGVKNYFESTIRPTMEKINKRILAAASKTDQDEMVFLRGYLNDMCINNFR